MLPVFRSLPIADRTWREPDLPPACRGYTRDTITLGWEERLKIRGRRRSDGGVEFGTSLPRGTQLRAGDCLVIDPLHVVVIVIERAEPVFVLQPRAAQEWALLAYHIGNRHLPLMVTDAGLVCPDVPGVELLLQQYGIAFVRANQPFTPATAPMDHQH